MKTFKASQTLDATKKRVRSQDLIVTGIVIASPKELRDYARRKGYGDITIR